MPVLIKSSGHAGNLGLIMGNLEIQRTLLRVLLNRNTVMVTTRMLLALFLRILDVH